MSEMNTNDGGAAGGAPRNATNAGARAAIAARTAALAKEGLGPKNYKKLTDPVVKRRVRAAGNAAGSAAYHEAMDFLNSDKCPRINAVEKDFLEFALSQLSEDELGSLTAQAGGSRGQRGGALGQSLLNFVRALCGKVRGAVDAGARSAAAALDARATAIGAATPGEIGAGVLRALPVTAGSAVGAAILSGHSSKVIALAMTALKGINAILPGAATVSVSTYSGLAEWLPLAGAAAPVAGKLFAIFVCYRAVVITGEFVRTKFEEFRVGGGFDYDRLLRALMRAIYTGIVTGARATPGVAYAAGSAVAAGARAAPGAVAAGARGVAAGARAVGRGAVAAGRGARTGVAAAGAAVMSAGRGTVAAGAAALAVVDGVIDAAVDALLGGNVEVAHALVDAAVGPDAPAAAVEPAAAVAAGDAAAAGAGAAAEQIPAGLDALALMAAAMPALEVVDENDYAMGGNGVPHGNQLSDISDIENARKSRKRKQGGGKRFKSRRNRKNRK
jgi:hypothetical protein